jgi:hypothetical protein
MLTGRLEKHKGITLLVDAANNWISVVHDTTGYHFEGPVSDDTDVRFIVATVIPTLQLLGNARA